MDPRHLSRLKEEQEKAIFETKGKILKCENFISDYKALQERLTTLPEKVTHEVMVPFGKFAFMPGQMVHTNEVMVLLGDNWFAERSAKQAAEIAGRRIQELDKNLAELNKQMKLLVPRLGFTSELEAENQVKSEVKEIREEYNEEAEKEWDARHRESVRKHKEQEKQKSKTNTTDDSNDHKQINTNTANDDAFWERLEELEKQELERGELESEGDSDCDIQENKNSRKVSFVDSKEAACSTDSDDDYNSESSLQETDSQEEDDKIGNRDAVLSGKKKFIHFSHSSTPVIMPHEMTAAGDLSIQSPADVYKLFTPPSILKKPSGFSSPNTNSASFHNADATSKEPYNLLNNENTHPIASSSQKAFSGQIVERVTPSNQVTNKSSGDQPRKVSKFKAKRMEQS